MQKKIFSERNGLTEVEENDSNDTLVLDDNAHKVNLHTRSYFFCMRLVLLRLLLKIAATFSNIRNLPMKNKKRFKINQEYLEKKGKIIF